MRVLSTVGVASFSRHGKGGPVPLGRGNVNDPLSRRSTAPKLSYCRVDAAGVPAEWVEATVATEGQLTIVYFLSGGYGVDPLEESRPSAGDFAVATGARVLTVACSPPGKPSHAAAVENAIAAYAWLLGEGCDVDLTAFTHDSTGGSLVEAILVAAENHPLLVPAGGIWSSSPRALVPPPEVAG